MTPIDWLEPDWPAPECVRAVSTTRSGGVSGGAWATLNLGDHVGVKRSRLAAINFFFRHQWEPVWPLYPAVPLVQVVAEAVGLELERGEGGGVGLTLGRVSTARGEGNLDGDPGLPGGSLDSCAAAEDDHVGQRHLLAVGLRAVELALDGLEHLEREFRRYLRLVEFRGDVLEIYPPYDDTGVRISFWGDEVEKIERIDPPRKRSIVPFHFKSPPRLGVGRGIEHPQGPFEAAHGAVSVALQGSHLGLATQRWKRCGQVDHGGVAHAVQYRLYDHVTLSQGDRAGRDALLGHAV